MAMASMRYGGGSSARRLFRSGVHSALGVRTMQRILNVATGLILLVAISATAAFLHYDRSATWERVATATNNLAMILEADISRTIRVYDLSLLGVIEGLAQPGLGKLSPDMAHRLLFDRAAMADYLGSILVLDTRGNIMRDSRSPQARKGNFSDRDYFRVHQERADVELYISNPYRSRLRKEDPSIAISRRLQNADGSFAGVVMGALRLAYFDERFGQIALGPNDTISLLRDDGLVLRQRCGEPCGQQASTVTPALMARYQASVHGGFVDASDGVERYYSYVRVADLPLIVSISSPVDDMMLPWRHRAWFTGPSTVAFCAAVLMLMMFFRGVLRQGRSETAQLTALAQTDGLTGLSNRRAFDAALRKAWDEAALLDRPLSLLFIDADNFKNFNDLYGHPAGDDLLRRLGQMARKSARRPTDVVARYGGEEFVVLLPDTGLRPACRIAEDIRQAVEQLRIRNGGGTVTVSVGVTAMRPASGVGPEDLVARADQALYAAKSGGRNQVRAEPPAEEADTSGLAATTPGNP
ncbi:sensor domain-containing diguanylate cyclase [Bordetella genomosp. 13]|uniref:GGDEF domain-containing protein n=1 Tax=Bordetella genomosp. 13 TaxID=463040 RepID=UPI0011A7E519|nr:sensor domain-containing diguanylate cyclase [Bordetella genomosp. 13]